MTHTTKVRYYLEWEVNWKRERVVFSVTAETTGYVGFGLSKDGKMSGADIVIGGVSVNGDYYFGDYHATNGDRVPVKDPQQNWNLHAAWENGTHTFLRFSRAFDTCDDDDYAINEDRIALIWAFGERDGDTEYHHQNRGLFNVHLLDPNYTPRIIDNEGEIEVVGRDDEGIQVWTIETSMNVPANDTTYWCTIHKPPVLPEKQHIVGYQVRFDTPESRRHIHHMILFSCDVPEETSAESILGPFVGQQGQSCLGILPQAGPMPVHLCGNQNFAWAAGGEAFFLPPHMGVPLGEREGEFFMLQIHYDNPNRRSDLIVNMNVDFFYTNQLRENEAGFAGIAHSVPGLPPSILIPPSSVDHSIYCHCAPECTKQLLPSSGMYIGVASLHAHISGRNLRLQHFRGNKELPWILSDSNYEPSYQTFRAVHEDVFVLPGDQLTVRCEYDNTWTNGSVVGGFSTRNEMCAAFFFYYNRLNTRFSCSSGIMSEEARLHVLGVRNITWDNSLLEFVAQSPPHLAGLPISAIADSHVSWTLKKRSELQKLHNLLPQIGNCETLGPTPPTSGEDEIRVHYPEVKPYRRAGSLCPRRKSDYYG